MENNPTVCRIIDKQSSLKVMNLLTKEVDAITFRFWYTIIMTLKGDIRYWRNSNGCLMKYTVFN